MEFTCLDSPWNIVIQHSLLTLVYLRDYVRPFFFTIGYWTHRVENMVTQ